MAKSQEEILAVLQKQKEDIEILLSSLEEAYSEAGITEKHYKEVKGKNEKKLKEVERKIRSAERKVAREERRGGVKRRGPGDREGITVGEMIEAEQGPVPVSRPVGEEMPPLTPAGAGPEAPETAREAPPSKPGKEVRFTGDDIKAMLSRFIKEIRPGGLEVLPKVEKMQVKLEKMHAFLDALKDERSSRDESLRRLTEEIGEMRSSIGSLDRKISQQEIMVTDLNTTIGDLKPQRFARVLKKEDVQLKMHDAKIQRLEDMNSVIVKRLGVAEEVLKKIGSLERVANFGSDIAKRLVEIEDSEKRMVRISDRIDSIFMELNKRLDEFMLYKAKQDTLDELSREMMKAIDSINTKIEKYAEKEDLDLLRETMEQRISGMAAMPGAPSSEELMKLQSQKDEIEGLLGMFEEQFKKGELKKEEYEKAKQINMERLESINNKIREASSAPVQEASQEPAAEGKPGEAKPAKASKGKTAPAAPAGEVALFEKKKPEEPGTVQTITVGEEPAEPEKPKKEKGIMEDLEESMRIGELSRDAFERVKKLLRRKKE